MANYWIEPQEEEVYKNFSITKKKVFVVKSARIKGLGGFGSTTVAKFADEEDATRYVEEQNYLDEQAAQRPKIQTEHKTHVADRAWDKYVSDAYNDWALSHR